MPARSLARLGGLAAIVAGVFWAFALPLVATQATSDPVGLRYDDFNRWLTLPFALLVAVLLVLRSLQPARAAAGIRRALMLTVLGAGLVLLGKVIEFWLVFFTDSFVAAIAAERPELDEWAGSPIGRAIFLAGIVVLALGGILVGAASVRRGVLPSWVGLALAATAPLLVAGYAVWSVSTAATFFVALVLGFTWIAIGLWLRASAGRGEAPLVRTR